MALAHRHKERPPGPTASQAIAQVPSPSKKKYRLGGNNFFSGTIKVRATFGAHSVLSRNRAGGWGTVPPSGLDSFKWGVYRTFTHKYVGKRSLGLNGGIQNINPSICLGAFLVVDNWVGPTCPPTHTYSLTYRSFTHGTAKPHRPFTHTNTALSHTLPSPVYPARLGAPVNNRRSCNGLGLDTALSHTQLPAPHTPTYRLLTHRDAVLSHTQVTPHTAPSHTGALGKQAEALQNFPRKDDLKLDLKNISLDGDRFFGFRKTRWAHV